MKVKFLIPILILTLSGCDGFEISFKKEKESKPVTKTHTPKALTAREVEDRLDSMRLKFPRANSRLNPYSMSFAGIDPRWRFQGKEVVDMVSGANTSDFVLSKQSKRMQWAYNGDFNRLLRE